VARLTTRPKPASPVRAGAMAEFSHNRGREGSQRRTFRIEADV
jgi:hypothetical protein